MRPAILRDTARHTIHHTLRLLNCLSLLEGQLYGNAPAAASLAVLQRVERDAHLLLEFLDRGLQRLRAELGPEPGELYGALDGMSYAVGHEVRRAFGADGLGGGQIEPQSGSSSPAFHSKLAHAHGLLNNCFQQSLITIALAVDSDFDAHSFFGDLALKREQSLALVAQLEALLAQVERAHQQWESKPGQEEVGEDNSAARNVLLGYVQLFIKNGMRFLMYKDWETFESYASQLSAHYRSVAAAAAAPKEPGHGHETWPMLLHSFSCYLATLLSQVRMREVLSPENSAERRRKAAVSSNGLGKRAAAAKRPQEGGDGLRGRIRLRNGGLYRLPDGGEYIMLRGGDGCNLLYPRRYGLASAPFYALERDGRLMARSGGGHHEGWTIADLEDMRQDFRRK